MELALISLGDYLTQVQNRKNTESFWWFMNLFVRYGVYKMSIFQGKVLLVKKLEIEKTKNTFDISVFKVVY